MAFPAYYKGKAEELARGGGIFPTPVSLINYFDYIPFDNKHVCTLIKIILRSTNNIIEILHILQIPKLNNKKKYS